NDGGVVVGGGNSHRYPSSLDLNLHIERRFTFRGYRSASRLGANNLTDHRNPTAVSSVVGSKTFMQFFGDEGRHFVVRIRLFGRAKICARFQSRGKIDLSSTYGTPHVFAGRGHGSRRAGRHSARGLAGVSHRQPLSGDCASGHARAVSRQGGAGTRGEIDRRRIGKSRRAHG